MAIMTKTSSSKFGLEYHLGKVHYVSRSAVIRTYFLSRTPNNLNAADIVARGGRAGHLCTFLCTSLYMH
jgi:hypothetical protein